MKSRDTIDFKINENANYRRRYVIIVNNKFTSLQIRYYFFRAYNIDINQ